MSLRAGLALCVVFILPGCSTGSREYELRGQVLGVDRQNAEVLVKHEEIPGLMAAMTMPFKVRDRSLIEDLATGDLIVARLVVSDDDAYLAGITRTGTAPPDVPPPAPVTPTGVERLKPGDVVPDQTFVDQDGRERSLRSWRGHPLAVTFIYTRCPLPTFCPLMDRYFADIQREAKTRPTLRDRVQLLSVSFDPQYDTPEVLKRHARTLGADPSVWNLVTGSRDGIERFAMRFGVIITRGTSPDGSDLTHTLGTAVIDRDGQLVKLYAGNEWTPSQLVADLESLQ
jgi:protein SCO1/2